MKPPPGDAIDTRAAAGLLEDPCSTIRAWRLVQLLKGDGLTRRTIEELLRPESASRLKAVLTDHLFPGAENDPGHRPADGSCHGGKVLVFRNKETHGP